MDLGVARFANEPAGLLGLLAGLTNQDDRITLIFRYLANFCLKLRQSEISGRRNMSLRVLGSRPDVDHSGIAAIDQLNRFGRRHPATATPDEARPEQQCTRDEDDRDKYKVDVIGEKLHLEAAGMGM